jgi:hypothetical protein
MNLISFPGQVPVFGRHDRPDLQWRFAQLYFVLGWRCGEIAARYGVARQRAGQILKAWTARAVETGYIQVIPPPPELPEFLVTVPSDAARRETLVPAASLFPLSVVTYAASDPSAAQ